MKDVLRDIKTNCNCLDHRTFLHNFAENLIGSTAVDGCCPQHHKPTSTMNAGAAHSMLVAMSANTGEAVARCRFQMFTPDSEREKLAADQPQHDQRDLDGVAASVVPEGDVEEDGHEEVFDEEVFLEEDDGEEVDFQEEDHQEEVGHCRNRFPPRRATSPARSFAAGRDAGW